MATAFQRGVRTNALIGRNRHLARADGAGLLVDHAHDGGHRRDLVLELAGGLRGGRAQLAAHAVFVLRLLGNVVALGHRFGGLQHAPVQASACARSIHGSRRMCVLASFCTQEMLSRPPATMTSAPSVMTRCAARAMDCNPELQKRLMLKPAVVMGSPARSAIWRGDVAAGGALAEGRSHDHILDFGGIDAGARHGVLHRMRAQRGAIGHVECALPALAEAGARGGYDDCFCHLSDPLICAECFAFLQPSASSSGAGVQNGLVGIGLRGDVLQGARDLAQSHLVGIEHGAAAPGRKAIAIEVHDVDVRTALRNAILDDAGALVDQRIDAALDDFLIADLARRDALLLCGTSR